MKQKNIRSKHAPIKLPVAIGKKIYPAPYLPSYHYTEFYNEQQELLDTVPLEEKQPTRNTRTIRIKGILYQIHWEPIPPDIATRRAKHVFPKPQNK